jgi:hypothetical protein
MPWIKCSEKMPEEYETVLCSMDVQGVAVVRPLLLDLHDKDHGRLWVGISACYPEINRVTHWMPLPEPPITESVPVANAKADLAPASGAQVQRLVGRQSEDA